MKFCMTAVSIILAGIVSMASNPQLCESVDPNVCLLIKAVAMGISI